MQNWKTTTNKKKIQRHINKVIRDMNKSLERDNLWLGRFYCRQKKIFYEMSEDGTYMYARICVEMTDRKTNRSTVYWLRKEDFMCGAWRFWEQVNSFITEYCAVWLENPRPSINNAWDYRKEGKK
jgi:hypothetical protein